MFSMYIFLQVRSNFLTAHALNSMHCWSIYWVVFCLIFAFSIFHVFFLPEREPWPRTRTYFLEPVFRPLGPNPPKGPIATENEDQEGAHPGFWRRPKGPELPGHLVEVEDTTIKLLEPFFECLIYDDAALANGSPPAEKEARGDPYCANRTSFV